MKPEEEEFQLGKVRTLLRDKRKPATIIICSVPVYSVVLCSIPFHSVAQGNISSLFFFFFFAFMVIKTDETRNSNYFTPGFMI